MQAKLIVNIWNLFLAITPFKWMLILGGISIFKPDFIVSYYRVLWGFSFLIFYSSVSCCEHYMHIISFMLINCFDKIDNIWLKTKIGLQFSPSMDR